MQRLLTQEEIADLLAPMENEAGISDGQAQKDRAEVVDTLAALSRPDKGAAPVPPKNYNQVRVEIGRGQITDEEFLQIKKGSIVPLEKRIDEPFDLYLDTHLIARGEIVRINDKIGLKVTEVTLPTQLSSKSK